MTEHLYAYDPAEALDSPEAIAVFVADAMETGDAAYIAKARGMSELAKETGLAREQLYKSLSEGGNPTLKTFLAVVRALGLEPTVRLR